MSKETKEWLEEKYIEWRNRQPRGADGVKNFAEYLGIHRNTLNNWMLRGVTPEPAQAVRLAQLGPEIYDLLGIPRPDRTLQLIIQSWGSLSDEARAEIDAIRERSAANREAGATGGRVAAHDAGHEN